MAENLFPLCKHHKKTIFFSEVRMIGGLFSAYAVFTHVPSQKMQVRLITNETMLDDL